MTRPLGDPRLLGLWQKGHSPVLPSAPTPQGSRVNQEKYKLPTFTSHTRPAGPPLLGAAAQGSRERANR